ncbi:MAG TPA: ABC transporter permease subunit [Actinoplanes sp.]|nr:ABC transporter permease subunit [Actinoplanes sp.]
MSTWTGDLGGRRRAAGLLGGFAVAGLLAALVGLPLVALARVALGDGPAGITRALGAPGAGRAVAHTVEVAVVVTALAVSAGAGLALAVERRPARSRGVLRILVASGLVVPEFVLGFAWTQAYGPTGLGDQLAGLVIPGLYGAAGIVLVLAAHAVPLAYLVVAAGLATHADADLERAARASGAGAVTVLRTITLPLLRVPLIAASALVFVSAVNSFAVPQLLGAPAGFATMSTMVYNQLGWAADPAAFTDLTVVALAMVVLVTLAVGPVDVWLGGSRAYTYRTDPAVAGAARRGGRLTVAAVCGYAGFVVGVPLLAVVLAAVTRGPGLPPVPANWTFANVSAAFAGSAGPALARSAWLAAGAAVLVPVLGLLVAGAAGRARHGALGTAVTLAYAVPGTALAVGIMIGYGRWLAGSALIILVAYLAKFWILGYRPVQAALDRLSPEPVRAARASGAGPPTAARTIVLPALRPAMLTAAVLVLLFAFHELTMSTILYGPGSETFAVVVLDQRELGNVGVTAVLALVLTAPVCLAAGLLVLAGRLWPGVGRPR